MGMSIGSIAHYETGDRDPDYLSTVKLRDMARAIGDKKLLAYFETRLSVLADQPRRQRQTWKKKFQSRQK